MSEEKTNIPPKTTAAIGWREVIKSSERIRKSAYFPTSKVPTSGSNPTIAAGLRVAVGSASSSETPNKAIARKSIVAKRLIAEGELLTEDNITVKRPGNGISPMRWNEVIGSKAIRNFSPDEMIEI